MAYLLLYEEVMSVRLYGLVSRYLDFINVVFMVILV